MGHDAIQAVNSSALNPSKKRNNDIRHIKAQGFYPLSYPSIRHGAINCRIDDIIATKLAIFKAFENLFRKFGDTHL